MQFGSLFRRRYKWGVKRDGCENGAVTHSPSEQTLPKKEEEVVEPSPRRGSEGFPHFWQKRQKIDKKSNNLLFLIRVQQIFIGVWRIFCKAVNRRVEYFLAVAR